MLKNPDSGIDGKATGCLAERYEAGVILSCQTDIHDMICVEKRFHAFDVAFRGEQLNGFAVLNEATITTGVVASNI